MRLKDGSFICTMDDIYLRGPMEATTTGEHTATKKLLCDAIDTNDADRVAAILKEHYRWLSKESLKSFTPKNLPRR